MFKKLNNRKIFSLLLVLVLVFGISISGFAATTINDAQPLDFELIVSSADVSYKAVTVEGNPDNDPNITYPDVTTHTSYIEFPQGSTQDLAEVDVTVKYDDNFILKVNNIQQSIDAMDGNKRTSYVDEVDFTHGYVIFSLVDSSNPENNKEFQVNAGIKGEDVEIIVTFDIHNAVDWLAGNYNGAYSAPNPNSDATLKARIQDAVDGFALIEPRIVTMKVGDPAMMALEKASKGNFYTLGANQGYIRKIGKTSTTTLGEFDINSYSGWMYKMNGEMPNVGAGQYTLTTNDNTMEWGFTMDYGQDLGGAPW